MGSGSGINPVPTGLPGPSASSTPPGARGPRRPRLPWAIGGTVVVIAVVVVLLVTGVFPTPRSNPSTAPAPLPVAFGPALDAANVTAAGSAGGPWTLWSATGVDSRTVRNWTSFLPWSEADDCALSSPGPTPAVPAYDGSIDSGLAPFWVLAYSNASSTSLIVVVVNGTALDAGTVDPSALCVAPAYGDVPAVGSFSSSAAAVAAGAVNASFLATFPGLNATLSLAESGSGGTSAVWEWLVEFTSCPAGPQVFGPSTPHYPGELDGQVVAAATNSIASPNPVIEEVTCAG